MSEREIDGVFRITREALEWLLEKMNEGEFSDCIETLESILEKDEDDE